MVDADDLDGLPSNDVSVEAGAVPLKPSRSAVVGDKEVLNRYLKARVATPRGSNDLRKPGWATDWLAAEALVVEVVSYARRLHHGDVARSEHGDHGSEDRPSEGVRPLALGDPPCAQVAGSRYSPSTAGEPSSRF